MQARAAVQTVNVVNKTVRSVKRDAVKIAEFYRVPVPRTKKICAADDLWADSAADGDLHSQIHVFQKHSGSYYDGINIHDENANCSATYLTDPEDVNNEYNSFSFYLSMEGEDC